ncbi:MAG: 30S ribosomal protein S17 [Candidatus Omnitrophica bacterium]|jgi:small subunit ribosomal protein S17|nr:30S ribosomal protein S17 [Candidatus Omnitrophota bacterium]
MGKRKSFVGLVTSDKMQKTRVVKVMHLTKHAKYGKIVKRTNKFKAHDENNLAKIGDTVRIVETRPLSKDKRWRISEIVKKAAASHIEIKEEVK